MPEETDESFLRRQKIAFEECVMCGREFEQRSTSNVCEDCFERVR